MSANTVALALEISTGKQAAIYDGSWNEWGNTPSLPCATGDKASV